MYDTDATVRHLVRLMELVLVHDPDGAAKIEAALAIVDAREAPENGPLWLH